MPSVQGLVEDNQDDYSSPQDQDDGHPRLPVESDLNHGSDEIITPEIHQDVSFSPYNSWETEAQSRSCKEVPVCNDPSFSSSGGTAPAATAALLENGDTVTRKHENGHAIDESELEAEQRRALERLDSDLSTFEAVEKSLLEASKEYDDSNDRKEESNTGQDVSQPSTKSPNSSSPTASAIPRLQRSTSGKTRPDNGHQNSYPDNNLGPVDSLESQVTPSSSGQLYSSAPVSVEDQSPPSPSTHQLIHSFSVEEADGSSSSPRENLKRGVSPRRHSGIPVRQNSFQGSSVPGAAAYILYKGDSETEGFERPDGGSYLARGVSASSDRDTDNDDVTISDLTGRARRAKKRSGIPSAWMAKVKGDASPHSTRSGSPRGSESDMSRPPMDRKVLDLKRWYCMSRPQYKTSCGVSSLVSCWNFLFSTLGYGSLKPLTQETAMSILGFPEPYDNIKFGSFTGNLALMRWFQELNTNFRVKGKCYFLYKPVGKNRTPGVTPDMALNSLKRGLRDPSMTFIYHCQNHYFCPVGFEESPMQSQDAYKAVADDKKDSWILIGETSRKFPALHCKNWKDICTDLNSKFPEFYDIRREWNGVRRKKSNKSLSENLHCIMVFQKVSAGLCTPPGSLQGRQALQTSSRPSRLPMSPGSVTSRTPPPEPLCECEEPGPVLEEEELGQEDLDSSLDDNDEEEENESDMLDDDEEEEELEGRSEDGSVSRV
ncbi:basic immunoglobulin-like variable motif-containing protein [Elysia marginata]|uniref:Basic immunoglobulin-like variable motif-containing protein n=1 Tax=Elysia marginata TaxID=1093978 RepID=A0AAV4IKZ2_9GAST|nr:basic immunoglobulin-like variable motif-containing protein [Elysia marginata]